MKIKLRYTTGETIEINLVKDYELGQADILIESQTDHSYDLEDLDEISVVRTEVVWSKDWWKNE